VAEDRHERCACICGCAKARPPNDGGKDGETDIKEVYEETAQEEKDGNMQESRQSFNRPGKMQLIDTFGKK